ncbi:J domain-containing protein [Brachybacterium alimentarium]|uniref:J domain-containing protein n=2 Tax=Brachybacterium alimentarium TaxID=47845 RepID=UPI0015CCE488
MALTHYETLGVPRDASRADITAAFRSQMRALHGDAGGDDELAKHVSSAYNVLSNASRRATYDRTRDCRADR